MSFLDNFVLRGEDFLKVWRYTGILQRKPDGPRHDKTNKMAVRPAKTQISLGIRPVWSESSLCAQWVAKDRSFLHADSEDSDQTGRMRWLIWVFAGRTLILLVLSCRGSDTIWSKSRNILWRKRAWIPTCFAVWIKIIQTIVLKFKSERIRALLGEAVFILKDIL